MAVTSDVAITPDGALAAVADHINGQLLVYRTDTREHIGSVDAGPHGVWAAPALSDPAL